jgi:hypothetical protein
LALNPNFPPPLALPHTIQIQFFPDFPKKLKLFLVFLSHPWYNPLTAKRNYKEQGEKDMQKIRYYIDNTAKITTKCPHEKKKPYLDTPVKIASYHCIECKHFMHINREENYILCDKDN